MASRDAGLAGWAREQLADRRVRHALFYLVASLLLVAAVALSKVALEHFVTGGRQGVSFAGALGVAAVFAVILRLFQTRIEATLTARFTRTVVARRLGLAELAQELGMIGDRAALQQHLVERLDQVLDTTGAALYLRHAGESFRRAAAAAGSLPDEVSENDPALVPLRLKQLPVRPDARSALDGVPQLWPLAVRGQTVGFVAGGGRNHAESFDPAEVSAVAELAERVAATLVILDPALLGSAPVAQAQPATIVPAIARDNLPRNLPALIGRDRELAQLRALIAANRLVTVTGSGGVGKTRLVIEAGAACLGEFVAGVWLVEFASLADASLVPSAVTSALGMEVPATRTPAEVLVSRLREQQILLVLDNCEHVVGAVATLLESLLAAAPSVKALVSSQEPIGIAGEQVFRLPSLSVPESLTPTAAEALAAGAVQLFVERARAADPAFVFDDRAAPVVTSICRRLDGIPLALEMAAARVPMLGVDALSQRLDERFRVLTGGKRTALPRQRTLHATLDWSFGLLAERERVVFRRVAIFAGGFTLEAATSVAAAGALDEFEIVDGLASLVAKSLVAADTSGAQARYRLLETTRAYALEKLAEAQETASIEASHARHFRAIFAPCFDEWTRLSDADFRARYAAEIDNLRLAVDWAFGEGGDTETGQALMGSSRNLWQMLSLANEAARRLDVAIERLTADTPPAIVVALHLAVGLIHSGIATRASDSRGGARRRAGPRSGRRSAARHRAHESGWRARDGRTRRRRRRAHAGGAAAARTFRPPAIAGRAFSSRVDWSTVPAATAAKLRPGSPPRRGVSRAGGFDGQAFQALGNLADSLWMQGDLDGAVAAARDALAQSRQSAFATRSNVGLALANLQGILTERGDLAEAAAVGREFMAFTRDAGVAWIVLDHFALRLAKSGQHAVAARLVGWNEAAVRAKDVRRQINEQRAYESNLSILRAKLSAAELERLMAEGATMSEDEVCRLAVES